MEWGTHPICDRHWKEQNGDRQPIRVIGKRGHCYITGCERTGDIFVRVEADTGETAASPYFVSDRHAFICGGLLTYLRSIPLLEAEIETDDDGNYKPAIRVIFHDGFDLNSVRLHVELLDEDDAS